MEATLSGRDLDWLRERSLMLEYRQRALLAALRRGETPPEGAETDLDVVQLANKLEQLRRAIDEKLESERSARRGPRDDPRGR